MWDKVRHRLQQFADRTTIQGIYEVYYVKSPICRLFWLLLVIGSNAMTAFQIYDVLMQYQNQISVTQSQQLPNGTLYYPPIKICYPFWPYWIDYKKVSNLRISNETLLYGVSFVTNVYISSNFNLSFSKMEFEKMMKIHGLKTVSEFFDLIKSDKPPGFTLNRQLVFNETEFDWAYNTFCYVCNVTDALYKKATVSGNDRSNLQLPDSKKSVSVGSFSESRLMTNLRLSNDEYNSYVYAFETQRFYGSVTAANQLNRTTFVSQAETSSTRVLIPPILYLNYDSGITLDHDKYRYDVSVSVNVHKWRNGNGVKCAEDQQTIHGEDGNCYYDCYSRYYATPPCICLDFFSAVLINEDTFDNLCHYCMYAIDESNDTCIGDMPADTLAFRNCSTPSKRYEMGNCTAMCANATKGCEFWDIQTTVKTLSYSELERKFVKNNYIFVSITYPLENGIFVISDVDSVTWEDLISSVGGLLGIWMGASILSYVQFIYLCCFDDCDCECLKRKEFPTNLAVNPKMKKRVHPSSVTKTDVAIDATRNRTLVAPKLEPEPFNLTDSTS